MSARELVTEHLDLWTGAVAKKSSSGRGGNGKVELTGIKKLRELILELAVRGKLVGQTPTDEPAIQLLRKTKALREQLVREGKLRRLKQATSAEDIEKPFEIPRSWSWATLPDVASYNPGKTPSTKAPKFWATGTSGIPWVSIADLNHGGAIRETTKAVTQIAADEVFRSEPVTPGTILMSFKLTVGKVSITEVPAYHNEAIISVFPFNGVSRDYLFKVLPMLALGGNTKRAIMGNTLNATSLAQVLVPLPPEEEQHRIVQKVDELMVLCDRLEQQTSDQLEAHETLVVTLLGTLTQSENATELADNWARLAAHFDTLFTTEQSIDKLKQTILQLAVMGRLVDKDEGDEPAMDFLLQIHARKTALANEKKIKRPKALVQLDAAHHSYAAPEHWAWASFEDVTDEISTGPFGSMIHKQDYVEGGIPLINPSHMIKGCIKEDSSVSVTAAKAEELSSYKIAAGDIVMARRGEVGRCAIITEREAGWLCGTGSFVLRFHPALNRQFIFLLFSTDTVRGYLIGNSVGTTMTNLNHGILKKMPVALPPVAEQHRIIQKVDDLMTLCDQLRERLHQAEKTRYKLAEAVVSNALC